MARLSLLLRQMSCNKTKENGKQKVLVSVENAQAVPHLFHIFRVMMDSNPSAIKPKFSNAAHVKNPKFPYLRLNRKVRPKQSRSVFQKFSIHVPRVQKVKDTPSIVSVSLFSVQAVRL